MEKTTKKKQQKSGFNLMEVKDVEKDVFDLINKYKKIAGLEGMDISETNNDESEDGFYLLFVKKDKDIEGLQLSVLGRDIKSHELMSVFGDITHKLIEEDGLDIFSNKTESEKKVYEA